MTDTDDDSPFLTCRHFLLCHTVWHDANNPDEGVSLGRILGRMRPNVGDDYPLVFARLFAYVQLAGVPGNYSLVVERVRIDVDETGEEVEADPREYGPYPVFILEAGSVDEFVFQMVDMPFRSAGDYEFRLRLNLPEVIVTLAVERIEARNDREEKTPRRSVHNSAADAAEQSRSRVCELAPG